MDWFTPKDHLRLLLATLYNEGILDRRQFEQLRGLKDDSNPGFIVDLLTVFCEESESIYREIDQLLKMPSVDYRRIVAHVIQLKGSCSSIGGLYMKACCEKVEISYEKNDACGIMRALDEIKNECFRLHIHFETIIELKGEIMENSTA